MSLDRELAVLQKAQEALKEQSERKEVAAKEKALRFFQQLTTSEYNQFLLLENIGDLLKTHPELLNVKFKIEYSGEDKGLVQPSDKQEKTLIDHLLYTKSEPRQVLADEQIAVFHKNIDDGIFSALFMSGAKVTDANAYLLFDRGFHQDLTVQTTAKIIYDFAYSAKTKGDDAYKAEDLAKILSGLGGGRSDVFTQLSDMLRESLITQDEYKETTNIVARKLLDLITSGVEKATFIQPLELLNKRQTILHLAVYAGKDHGVQSYHEPLSFSALINDMGFALKNIGVSQEASGEVCYKAITQKNGDNKTPQELARSLGYNALALDIARQEGNQKRISELNKPKEIAK